MNVKPFFRWYDLWVGAYIDTENKTVYICPLPTIGIKITLTNNKINKTECKTQADKKRTFIIEYIEAHKHLSVTDFDFHSQWHAKFDGDRQLCAESFALCPDAQHYLDELHLDGIVKRNVISFGSTNWESLGRLPDWEYSYTLTKTYTLTKMG